MERKYISIIKEVLNFKEANYNAELIKKLTNKNYENFMKELYSYFIIIIFDLFLYEINFYLDSKLTDVSKQNVLLENYVGDGKVDIETFAKEVLGENKELPDSLKEKFKKHKIITLDDFKAELKNIVPAEKLSEFEKLAQQMSELQPERMVTITENGETKSVARRILTKGQAQDVLNCGHINNPEFLKEFYVNALGHRKFMDNDKYKFVPQSTFDSLKKDLTNYVKSIVEQAQKSSAKEITSNILKKASKHNFKMNLINWGSGFAVSALFLSTLIPKMQYWITKMRTGQDNFPGTQEYRNEA